MVQIEGLCCTRNSVRFFIIERKGIAVADSAETAGTSTNVSHYEKRCGTGGKAFGPVRASSFGTDSMKPVITNTGSNGSIAP
jgi:hypothetical protein